VEEALTRPAGLKKGTATPPLATLEDGFVGANKKQRAHVIAGIKHQVIIVFFFIGCHLPLQRAAIRDPFAPSVCIFGQILVVLSHLNVLG
jgi:hypothetical protein